MDSSNITSPRNRASQLRLARPLSLNPSLLHIYTSALESQVQSRNIVACNPFTKEAEELAYPLTSYERHAVTMDGIGHYMCDLGLGWCCWCSLGSDKPSFARMNVDPEGVYLDCFGCGFYVPLDQICKTATRYVTYPEVYQKAPYPVTICLIGVGEEFPLRREYTVDFTKSCHLDFETRANVKSAIKSPESTSSKEGSSTEVEEDCNSSLSSQGKIIRSKRSRSKSKSKSKFRPYGDRSSKLKDK